MSLTQKQISNLRALLRGESVSWTSFNEALLQDLISEELVKIIVHRTHKKIVALYNDRLQIYLESKYEELRGIDWENDDSKTVSISRAELAAVSGNSKTTSIRTCPGFLVNSYTPIHAKLRGKEFVILPEVGSMLFIADWEFFEISENVLVIGIENMENFRMIHHQMYLFPNKPTLFVSRYPQSKDLRFWLQKIPNQYIHFGDFDLAGMHIYETEFYKYLGEKASFYIPQDIECRLSQGSATRYNEQYQKYKSYIPQDERLLPLYKMIHFFHRCYDQEGYIQLSQTIHQQNPYD